MKKWNIDKKKSFMIGDKAIDEKCAKKSKLDFYYAKDDLFKQYEPITISQKEMIERKDLMIKDKLFHIYTKNAHLNQYQ